MPTILLTDPFREDFDKLTGIEQKQARKALRMLAQDPRYPSLQIHKIRGTAFWEAYVNMDIRIIFENTGDTLIVHAIGHQTF
ncbi:type II toxin-antitoxin system YafQ family toxin [Effusibacillus lacus]|uniref:DNA helicase n=1 Tax=Effusibacillus lacus TaxID=1348429 RepID=A0A292YLE1_9BACL|nr:DNA helicase [Effusibacillus lacus]TCS71851.1 hypothetical protein EDD64_12467 [Effusibacillus lacus]GAX89583.1 DNA helicase [Effusibacillus lacus]